MEPAETLVAITGASGVIYGVRLVQVLAQKACVDVIVSRMAERIGVLELGYSVYDKVSRFARKVYWDYEMEAMYSSSSSAPKNMVIAPCSIKTLSAIAHGYASNLVVRAALAVLRLARKLVLVVRETPLGIIELENMLKLAKAGAIILPACPAFYHAPKTVEDMVDFIVGKVLEVLGYEHNLYRRWQSTS
ncbi:MAG TPA: UbiX family flavin prenyltransferase [Pyrodictium sp.]|nr:UbiX family flavin prenyltransferase [Pyrodictium sp.]